MARFWIGLSCLVLLSRSLTFAQAHETALAEWLVTLVRLDEAKQQYVTFQQKKVVPREGDVFIRQQRWQPAPLLQDHTIDLASLKSTVAENMMYVATYISVIEPISAQLKLACVAPMTVFMNGLKIAEESIVAKGDLINKSYAIRLEKGWNLLVVEIETRSTTKNFRGALYTTHHIIGANCVTSNRPPVDFTYPVSQPFVLLSDCYFGSSFQGQSGRLYPLKMKVTDVGQSHRVNSKIIVHVADRYYDQREFRFQNQTEITLNLSAIEVFKLVDGLLQVDSFLAGRPNDRRRYQIPPEQILTSLFTASDLTVEAAMLKPLFDDLRENSKWHRFYSGEQNVATDSVMQALARCGSQEDWTAFRKILEDAFVKFKSFSQMIKRDTLFVLLNLKPLESQQILDNKAASEQRFRTALSLCESDRRIRVQIDRVADFGWLETSNPNLFQSVRQCVEQGQFKPSTSMWADSGPIISDPETFIRQLLLGKRYLFEKFDLSPSTITLPLSFGAASWLPQVVKEFGFDTILFESSGTESIESRSPLFLLKGSDGSEILAVFLAPITQQMVAEELADRIKKAQSQSVHSAFVSLPAIGSDGKPNTSCLAQIRALERLSCFPTIFYGEPNRAFSGAPRELPQITTAELGTVVKSFSQPSKYPIWQRKITQKTLRELKQAEMWSSLAQMLDKRNNINKTWQRALFIGHENAAFDHVVAGDQPSFQSDNETIEQSIESSMRKALHKLTQRVALKGKGMPVLAYHPLTWPRHDWIAVPLRPGQHIAKVSNDQGKSLSFQQNGKELIFFDQIPALGYSTFWLEEGNVQNTASSLVITESLLENDGVRIEINPGTGNIRRFYDKHLGRELIPNGQEGNILQFYTHPKEVVAAAQASKSAGTWQCESVERIEMTETGPERAILRYVRTFQGLKFMQDYILYANLPRLDLRLEMSWQEREMGVSLIFVKPPEIGRITIGDVDGKTDMRQVSAPSWRIPACSFVALTHADYGFMLQNDSRCEVILEPDHLEMVLVPKYQKTTVEQFELHYSLMPHSAFTDQVDGSRLSAEISNPCIAAVAESQKGDWKQTKSFLQGIPVNVTLTGIKFPETHQGIILRFQETEGAGGSFFMAWHAPVQKAWQTTVQEEKVASLPFSKKGIELTLRPYEIVTLLIE